MRWGVVNGWVARPYILPVSETAFCNESIVDARPEEQAGLRVRAGQFLQYGHQNADTGIKKYLLRAVEKRPDEINSFKTVLEVRTYGEMITPLPISSSCYPDWRAASKSKGRPRTERLKPPPPTYLKSSFDNCD
jgi:hypothetical protein